MAQLPEPTEKASGEQEVHVDAASNAKRPAVHVVHEEAPVEDDLPGAQFVHCDSSLAPIVALCLPAGQGTMAPEAPGQ